MMRHLLEKNPIFETNKNKQYSKYSISFELKMTMKIQAAHIRMQLIYVKFD